MTSSSPTDRTGAGDATTEACAPDCAERTACPVVGEPGHWQCGTCPEHQGPRHHCGCLAAPVPVDRRDADDATWEATLARLEAAPVADVAANVAVEAITQDWMLERHQRQVAEMERDMLRAQVAALKPAPGTDSSGQAVQRVLELADELASHKDPAGDGWVANRIRAAVAGSQRDDCPAGPQRDHGGEA